MSDIPIDKQTTKDTTASSIDRLNERRSKSSLRATTAASLTDRENLLDDLDDSLTGTWAVRPNNRVGITRTKSEPDDNYNIYDKIKLLEARLNELEKTALRLPEDYSHKDTNPRTLRYRS